MRIDAVLIVIAVLLLPGTALAYIGPGLGLGAIGVFFGILLSILLAVLGIFWYPIKRMLGLGKKPTRNSDAS